ncbi:hypothetical protein LP419_39230 [Massilia sp. H-1]|nr:hypothetical protein LP419_39230 [Massilia sp. H-1]
MLVAGSAADRDHQAELGIGDRRRHGRHRRRGVQFNIHPAHGLIAAAVSRRDLDPIGAIGSKRAAIVQAVPFERRLSEGRLGRSQRA